MLDQTLFPSIRKPLTDAQTVILFLPSNPGMDRTAACLGLFLSLNKTGKQTSVVCPTQMQVEYSDLVGVDRIKTDLSGQNLTVSFDYLEDSIEKVSYNIENDKFNLVIQPKSGFPPLSSKKVAYNYSGSDADLVFIIGIRGPDDLGKFKNESETVFKKEKLVSIGIDAGRGQAGVYDLLFPEASSFSEIVTHLISRLSLPIDTDIATNLMLGIEKATGNFSTPRVGASTFEAAAFCARAGARRVAALRRARERQVKTASLKPASLKPMPQKVSAAKKPEEVVDNQEKIEEEKAAPDWFEPKIYKGNTKI